MLKRFVLKILLLFFLLAALDYAVGIGMDYVSSHITTGEAGRDNFITDSVMSDVLIMGSSRAVHHYNARLLSDSLGLSCYNCGEGACGIIMAYARLTMLMERHVPQHIIYEVTPMYDFLVYDDNRQSLGRLKLHYDRQGVDSIFAEFDTREKYMMKSGLYRHNTTFLKDLLAFVSKSNEGNDLGFEPFNVPFNPLLTTDRTTIHYDRRMGYEYDSLKIKYLNKFIDLAQHQSTLTFVVSPVWYGQDTLVMDYMKKICLERSISLLDFSNDSKYVHHDEYFSDGIHLNARGADEFTRDLLETMREKGIL